MKENSLTNKDFWKNYWDNKPDLVFKVQKNLLFGSALSDIVIKYSIKSGIELGGFPGYYAIYLKKFLSIDSCLIDYFIHPDILKNLLEVNDLSLNSIDILEEDLFSYNPKKLFDLVCSFGLIEHFDNPLPILKIHLDLLNPGGIVYITLPNFRGINGWVQKVMDPVNLSKHNLQTMNPEYLKNTLESLGVDVLECGYWGKFTVWLEDEQNKPLLYRIFKGLIWVIGKVISRPFQFQNRFLSPYITILAIKKN